MLSLKNAIQDNRIKEVYRRIDEGESVNPNNYNEISPLTAAAAMNNQELVLYLLQKGADVNWQTHDGYFALYFAAANGFDKMVQILLRAGANTHLKNRFNYTALSVALMKQQDSTVRLLLQRGAQFGEHDQHMVSSQAVWEKYLSIKLRVDLRWALINYCKNT